MNIFDRQKNAEALVSAEILRQMLTYNEENGVLTWRERPQSHFSDIRQYSRWRTMRVGRQAGCRHPGGYVIIKLTIAGHESRHFAHRLVWPLVYGRWPKGQIDHVDGDRSNNRLSNLRDVPSAVNGRNLSLSSRNTTGTLGVYWLEKNKVWRAQIRFERKLIDLGRFKKKSDAIAARKVAERQLGYHENHGKRPSARLDAWPVRASEEGAQPSKAKSRKAREAA